MQLPVELYRTGVGKAGAKGGCPKDIKNVGQARLTEIVGGIRCQRRDQESFDTTTRHAEGPHRIEVVRGDFPFAEMPMSAGGMSLATITILMSPRSLTKARSEIIMRLPRASLWPRFSGCSMDCSIRRDFLDDGLFDICVGLE